MTAPERFAEKSDSLLHRGRRPYMTHQRHGQFKIFAAQIDRCTLFRWSLMPDVIVAIVVFREVRMSHTLLTRL